MPLPNYNLWTKDGGSWTFITQMNVTEPPGTGQTLYDGTIAGMLDFSAYFDITMTAQKDVVVYHRGDGLLEIHDFNPMIDELWLDSSLKDGRRYMDDGAGGSVLAVNINGNPLDKIHLVGVEGQGIEGLHVRWI